MRPFGILIFAGIRRSCLESSAICFLLALGMAFASDASGQSLFQSVTYDTQGNLVAQSSSTNVVAPGIVAGPVGRLAQIGGSVAFSVVANGTPVLSYQWRFNNANISAAANPSAATSTLILNGLTAANFGSYTVAVTNGASTVVSQAASLQLDSVGDGIPDSYKLANFGPNWQSNPAASGANADPDGDGFTNAEEYADGTNPNSAASHFYRLTVNASSVLAQPSAPRYAPNSVVTLTALPKGDQQFYSWSILDLLVANAAPVVSTSNPLTLTITTSYAVTPTYTSQPLAQAAVPPSFTRNNHDARTEAFLVQADGKQVIGGTFDAVSGVAHSGVARFNANGTLDNTFNASTNSTVVCLAQQADGKLLIGGYFDNVNGAYRSRLARLNVDGTLDSTFNANDSVNDVVRTVAVRASDGKILITGNFGNTGTPNRNGVARLNADGSLDNTFATGTGVNSGTVWAGAWLPNGQVVIGGQFTSFNGVAANRLARLNADGSVDAGFVASADDTVYEIARRADGDLLVAGYFGTIDGVAHRGFARLSGTNGGYNPAVNQGTGLNDGNIGGSGLVIQADGKAVIGGSFSGYNGSAQRNVARINADGSLDAGFAIGGTGVDNPIYGVGLDAAGNTLVGGPFNFINDAPRLGIARLLAANGNPDPAYTVSNSYFAQIYALVAQPNGAVIAAGPFNVVNGIYRPYVARLKPDQSLDAAFNAGSGPDATVNAIALAADGKVVVGGNFMHINGQTAYTVVRFNADGSLDAGFGPVGYTNNNVNAVAIQRDGKIVVGGYFTTFGNAQHLRLARLNADGTLDSTFYPALDNAVLGYQGIAVQPDAKILVGGNFGMLNGDAMGNLVRLNPDGTRDPNFSLPMPTNAVYAIVLQPDGKILLGGTFDFLAGSNHLAYRLARLNADGTVDPAFRIGPGYGFNSNVYTLSLQNDGRILAYGSYSVVDNVNISVTGLPRLNADGSIDPEHGYLLGGSIDNQVYTTAVLSDDSVVIGGPFAHVGGLARLAYARYVTVPGLSAGTVTVSPGGPNFATGASVTLSVTPVAAAGMTVASVTFESSADGVRFQYLATGAPATGGAWTALAVLPPGATYVRAVVTDASTNVARSFAAGPFLTPPVVNGGAQIATGYVGAAFQFQATAVGPLTGFSATGLPAWATAMYDANLGVLTISGTPDVPGVSVINLLPANAAGSTSAMLTVTVYNRFAGWASRYFTQVELSNPAVSGPLGDATGAGVSNLLKYALGIAPKTLGLPTGLPAANLQTYNGQKYLTLTYTRDKSATDVALAVQVSGDLLTWNGGGGNTVEVSRTDNGNGTETVVTRDAVPTTGSVRRFIRLQVTQISF